MYQVGDVNKCDNDDPKFEHLADAIGFAFTWALHGKDNGDYGDWIGIWGISTEELYLPDDIAVVNSCAPSGPKIFWSEYIDNNCRGTGKGAGMKTTEFKNIYAKELYADTLVGQSSIFNFRTGKYDTFSKLSDLGDLSSYVAEPYRIVYEHAISEGVEPAMALKLALAATIWQT